MMKMCYDVFYDSFMDEEVPSESTNVGLEVENYKFTMGDKGRITTTHCQPRAHSKEPYDTLSKKLNKVGEELKNFIAEVITIQDANKDTADLNSFLSVTKCYYQVQSIARGYLIACASRIFGVCMICRSLLRFGQPKS
jgi:hypothetical protein